MVYHSCLITVVEELLPDGALGFIVTCRKAPLRSFTGGSVGNLCKDCTSANAQTYFGIMRRSESWSTGVILAGFKPKCLGHLSTDCRESRVFTIMMHDEAPYFLLLFCLAVFGCNSLLAWRFQP